MSDTKRDARSDTQYDAPVTFICPTCLQRYTTKFVMAPGYPVCSNAGRHTPKPMRVEPT